MEPGHDVHKCVLGPTFYLRGKCSVKLKYLQWFSHVSKLPLFYSKNTHLWMLVLAKWVGHIQYSFGTSTYLTWWLICRRIWGFWKGIKKIWATLILEHQNHLIKGMPKNWSCSNFLNSFSKTPNSFAYQLSSQACWYTKRTMVMAKPFGHTKPSKMGIFTVTCENHCMLWSNFS